MEAEELLKRYEIVKKYTQGERDFSGINLNEANLSRINLSQANLSHASLFITNLSGANLSQINLSDANLNVARLSSTNLTKAILNRATLNVANLVRADLTEAQLVAVTMIRGELIRAELSRANFTEANLSGADLREARMFQANFNRANLSGGNLRGISAKAAIFVQTDLHGADLTKADLQGADFRGAELRQVILTQANLSGADLSGANLRWADLSGANLSGADLSDAKLSGANLLGANLSQANLSNASLVHADLTHSNFIRADWDGVDLSGAILTGTKLYEVSRFNLKAEEITCEWVDLSPQGDHSQVYRFESPEIAKRFFNHTPPSVQIVIDFPLNQNSNLSLATTYHKIAEIYPMINRPPTIEVASRRTTLTFRIDNDEYLFPVACLVILPFQDRVYTPKNVLELIRLLQADMLDKSRLEKLVKLMNEGLETINQLRKVTDLTILDQTEKFFQYPTQVLLKNSSDRVLMVQSHPFFGKQIHQSPELIPDTNQSINKFSLPSWEQLISFVESFYYLSSSN